MLKEAAISDIDLLTSLLKEMNSETGELTITPEITQRAVRQSFSEGVTWFLFEDEVGKIFGTCHVQSVHAYWRSQKRYYVGGFYLQPSHRGRGLFVKLVQELKDWVIAHGGAQLYAHIHEKNTQSIKAFGKAQFHDEGYKLYINHWGE